MSGRLAGAIAAATDRVAALKHSLKVYGQEFPGAYARVAAQLDDAHADLVRLQALAEETVKR